MSLHVGSHGGSDDKQSACNAGDPSLIPESGKSPGEGNDYQLQYSCLENPTDRGAWQAIVYGVPKSTTEQLILSLFDSRVCMPPISSVSLENPD